MAKKIEALALKTAELTRRTHELGIPVMILFEVYLHLGRRAYLMSYY